MKNYIFSLVFVLLSGMVSAQSITALEYFINTDPGFGSAMSVAVPAAQADGTYEFNFDVNTGSLPTGIHTLYVRTQDSDGDWSLLQSRTFLKIGSGTTSNTDIQSVEYFIDTDPGFGSGTTVSDFTTLADGSAEFDFEVATTGLSDGIHTLYVRALDGQDRWSLLQSRTFIKIGNGTGGITDIQSVEYFIDEDPGFGSGTSVSAPAPEADGSYTFDFSVDVSTLGNGIHTLYVRAQDSNGAWSLLQSRTFVKLFSGNMGVPDITAFEYFVDESDNTEQFSDFEAAEDVTVDIPVDVGQLEEGTHTFFIRAKDSDDTWGFWVEQTFEVDNSVVIVPSFTLEGNCIDAEISCNNTSQGLSLAESILWDFGDGTTSTEENPTHIYTSVGNYTITLTLTDADGTNYDFSSTIEITGRPLLSIRSIDCFPYQAEYEVMEEGIVHHYFILEDGDGNPYPNATVSYRVGSFVDVYSSTVSDEQGFIDLDIKTSGAEAGDNSDDIIGIGFTQNITFEDVELNIPSPSPFCTNVPEILVNDFEPFNVSVVPHTSTSQKYGMYVKGSAEAEVCAGCFGLGTFGISAIDIGVSLKGASQLEIEDDLENGDVVGFNVQFTNSLGIGGKVELATADGSWIKGNFVDSEIGFNLKRYDELYLSESNFDDMLTGLFTITGIFPPYDSNADVIDPLRTVLEAYLIDAGLTVFESYVGTGDGYEFLTKSGTGNLNFALNGGAFSGFKGTKFSLASINTQSEYYVKDRLYLGINSETKTGLRNFGTYNFLQADFELFKFDYNYIQLPLSESFKRGFEVVSVKSRLTNSFTKGEISYIENGILDEAAMQTYLFTNKEYTNKLKLSNICMTWLENESFNTSYDNSIANVLVHNGSKASFLISSDATILGNQLTNLTNHIQENYPYVWDNDTYQNGISKKYSTQFNHDWSFDGQFSKGLGAKGEIKLSANAYYKLQYPYFDSHYCHDLDRYLRTVDYYDTESVVDNFDPEVLNKFLNAIQAAIDARINQINDYLAALFIDTAITVGGGVLDIIWIVNSVRDVFQKSNSPGKSYVFDDYSLLTVGIANDDSVFELGTDVNFSYYYPEGRVQGVAGISLDTFIVVSDLFYLDAVYQGDTLSTAPNGDFLIFTELGMDDLDYLGLPEDAITNVYYKGYNDSLWTTLGSVGDTLTHNGLGNYAIGFTLAEDNNAPMVEITVPSDYQETKQIGATISDIESGINWSSVGVTANGEKIPYERVDYTNEIIIDLDTLDSSGEYSILVYARDNRLNYGFDVAGFDYIVGVDKPQVFELINKVYPNPTNDILNIQYDLDRATDISISILDINGQSVLHKSQLNHPSGTFITSFNTQRLSTGIYLVEIIADRKREVKKVVIQ